jgi:hypothetical protein
MAITVHAIQLPTAVESGARGGPSFDRSVFVSNSGKVFINQNYPRPVWRWTVGFSEVTDTEAMQVRNFFLATRGGRDGFLFKDPRDHTAVDQPFVSSVTYRRYTIGSGGGAVHVDRKITRPTVGYTSGGGLWSGEFLIPVRIDLDHLDINMIAGAGIEPIAGIPSLSLVEILE